MSAESLVLTEGGAGEPEGVQVTLRTVDGCRRAEKWQEKNIFSDGRLLLTIDFMSLITTFVTVAETSVAESKKQTLAATEGLRKNKSIYQ